LLLLRLCQGLAASGEQAAASGMSLEHSPQNRRAFFTSFTACGSHAGAVLAMVVYMPILALPEAALLGWGWRLPFWIGAAVAVVGYFVRRNLRETPIFEASSRAGDIVRMPLLLLFRCYRVDVLRVICCALMATVGVIYTVYGLSYAVNIVKIEQQVMVAAMALSGCLGIVAIPLWAIVADKIGRKPVFLVSAISGPISMLCYFLSIDAQNLPLIYIFSLLTYGVAYGAFNGIWAALFSEMFDSRVRLSGLGIGAQLGFGISGTAPTLAVAFSPSGAETWLAGACLTVGACAIAGVSVLTTRETYAIDLRACGRSGPLASLSAGDTAKSD
jgi:MFS family permease